MATSDNIYLDYYSFESLASKWDSRPPVPTRRIQIIPPNAIDTKSSSVGGPPTYDPSSMSHTQQTLFRQKPLYVAPLAYYALRTLRPWCFGIAADGNTLGSWITVSTTEGDERVNLGDIIAPWAKGDISLLDPATWAFLIQLYNGLPEHYSRYKLALNDPYLPMLSAIPSTPTFSTITVLDLSNCDDLHDSNISQLKILTSLCVLDTSCTHLTDQAIRNLTSTLLLQEPGPLRLQSWSLRNCASVTNRSLESLGYFPMLCLLDLRGTKVEPHQSMHRLLNWSRSCVLSPLEHFDFFWPQPQFGIPARIQDLKPAAYSIVEEGDKPENERQRPWIVHVDRQYPSDWGLQRKPHWKPPSSNNTLPWYSYDYSDGYSDGYSDDHSDIDVFEADGLFIDGDNFGDVPDSGDGFDEEEAELSPSEFSPSSPLEPTSSIFGDETSTSSRLDPASMTAGITNAVSSGTSDINAAKTQSTSRPMVLTIEPQPSPTELDQLMALVVGHESAGPAPGVPHFYNARAQAELAPPKTRKRRRRYSSASSESYDSDEEREKEKNMEDELRRRRIEAISDKDWQRMLLRQPPEWSEAEMLIATVRALKQSRSEYVPAQPDLSTAKKRRVGTSEASARWAQMKASSKGPGQVPSQSTVPRKINTIGLGTSSQIRPPVAQTSTPTPGDRAPVRRTTLGRAPRPPGSIVRKPR